MQRGSWPQSWLRMGSRETKGACPSFFRFYSGQPCAILCQAIANLVVHGFPGLSDQISKTGQAKEVVLRMSQKTGSKSELKRQRQRMRRPPTTSIWQNSNDENWKRFARQLEYACLELR